MPRPLFLSFRSLLIEGRQGNLDDRDLREGLFYLECSRIHAHTPWMHDDGTGRFNELQYLFTRADGTHDGDLAGTTHRRLVSAFLAAEAAGRAAWRPEEGVRTYHQLNDELLAPNGFARLKIPRTNVTGHTGADWHIRDAIRASGLKIDVRS